MKKMNELVLNLAIFLGRSISVGDSLIQQPFSLPGQGQAENLASEMANLMHDYEVVSRINSMIGTLKAPYEGFNQTVSTTITFSFSNIK